MLSHFHLYGEQRSSGVMGRRNGPSGLRDDDDDDISTNPNFDLSIPKPCHHHHHLRVVLTDSCAAPCRLKISVLHRDESGIALASSWTKLSQVRRGRPGGLVQLVDGFLPS